MGTWSRTASSRSTALIPIRRPSRDQRDADGATLKALQKEEAVERRYDDALTAPQGVGHRPATAQHFGGEGETRIAENVSIAEIRLQLGTFEHAPGPRRPGLRGAARRTHTTPSGQTAPGWPLVPVPVKACLPAC
jgi:hypothetical protein